MREMPLVVVLGRAKMGFPPSLRLAPRTKSIWPPTPLKRVCPMLSAQTCPVRSISMALLMAVMRGMRRMIVVSLT